MSITAMAMGIITTTDTKVHVGGTMEGKALVILRC